jgi:3-mercaptopyruvate sulfurtransferase SseA
MQTYNENVKSKKCLWCDRKLYKKSKIDGTISAVVCEDCKQELKLLKEYIGKEEWYELIKRNGIAKEDVYASYEDYSNFTSPQK